MKEILKVLQNFVKWPQKRKKLEEKEREVKTNVKFEIIQDMLVLQFSY